MSGKRGREISERFWSKVDIRGEDECWNWTWSTRKGYGQFSIDGRMIQSNKVSYQITYGEYDTSLCVCHKCDNRACCNPWHLILGTQKENIQDCIERGRRANLRGEQNACHKLTEPEVRLIRSWHSLGLYSNIQLGQIFGVSDRNIGKVVNRESWTHI